MAEHPKIAILGGGISGLAAAYRLQELRPDAELVLLEAGDRLGGAIRTERVEGFCIEHGPDSLLTQVPWGLDLCRRVGLADDLLPTSEQGQGVYVVCRGQLRRVPDGLALMAPRRLWPIAVSPILSLRGKLRLACEYFVPARKEASEESLAAFATRRLGREAFERLVQPLVSGIFMGSPDALSVQATFPRFVEMEAQHGGLIRAMRKQQAAARQSRGQRGAATGGPAYGMFVAPRYGMEQLTRTIAACLPPEAVWLEAGARELTPLAHGKWRLVWQTRHEEPCSERFDAVIVATPSAAAARLLHRAAPTLASELSAIEHTSCAVVSLALDRDQVRHPLDAFGFVTPLIERRAVTAATFCHVKYAGRAPAGACLLRAYLGGAANPEVVDWSEGQLKRAALDDLRQLLGIRGEPRLVRISRHRQAMPQYELGHLARVDKIERLVARLPGLALAGNAYRGSGVAHCIHSGELAAERVAAGLPAACAAGMRS